MTPCTDPAADPPPSQPPTRDDLLLDYLQLEGISHQPQAVDEQGNTSCLRRKLFRQADLRRPGMALLVLGHRSRHPLCNHGPQRSGQLRFLG